VHNVTIHSYDLNQFDFPRALRRVFGEEDLSRLGADVELSLRNRDNDQSTPLHRSFYESFAEHLEPLYQKFVRAHAQTVLDTTDFCYQRVPTFRAHLPGNLAVGEFHTDGEYHHQDGEVNFWVPFTRTWGNNSIWVETSPGSGEYGSFSLEPGQYLVFDAVNLRHGNHVNDTGSTRVSWDFRCIPLSRYAPGGHSTITANKRLVIGDYFTTL
jgi:hypothetical protein